MNTLNNKAVLVLILERQRQQFVNIKLHYWLTQKVITQKEPREPIQKADPLTDRLFGSASYNIHKCSGKLLRSTVVNSSMA